MTGAHLNNVTSVKHKPAGGIAMSCGLITGLKNLGLFFFSFLGFSLIGF